ncbi:MAG: sialidase family protein [candidate division WOR-3 bacterium]
MVRLALLLMIPCSVLLTLAAGQPAFDTIGYTTRDRQVYGPAIRYIVNDTLRGVHAVWKDSMGIIRYNFRPRRGVWRWPEGTPVSDYPRNLGGLDVDIAKGQAMISCDYLARGTPTISFFRDSSVGQGRFQESNITTGYRECLVGTTTYGWYKFMATRNESLFFLGMIGRQTVGPIGPFPGGNLAVSKQIGRYGCIWVRSDEYGRQKLYLRQTPNNGQTWYATACLSDSVPSYLSRSMLGGCATYDSIRLHLVADFYDGENANHSQLWYYCPQSAPAWSLVHEYVCPESTRVGELALAACRPSIGIDRRRQRLYVVWEQFDPDNVEPLTGLARADIWARRSDDLGATWSSPVRLTQPDGTSKRFPSLAEVVDDTLHVLYFADQVAGCWEQGEGPQTNNAVVYLRCAWIWPGSVAESCPGPGRTASTRSAVRRTNAPDLSPIVAYNPAGRRVQSLTAPGVYFVTEKTGGGMRVERVVLVR